MQSKSPFKKVDIFDGRASSYRNPSTVIQPIVGAIVGNQIAKTASELGTKAITTSMNKDQRAAEAAAGDLKHQRAMEIKWGEGNTGPAKKPATPDIYTKAEYDRDQFMNTDFGKSKGFDLVKKGREGKGTHGVAPKKIIAENFQKKFIDTGSPYQGEPKNGKRGAVKPNFQFEDSQGRSPFYHNESAVGSIAGAAQAIGSTGAFGEPLPPPNQVAESGSYAGTGDRMLEMDSNPVSNQSIGRDTDVASQLFGSGQRASMLAMKGTPLHNAGHGENKAHSHSSDKTTKFENNVKTLISDYSSEHDNVPEKPKKYINPFTASVNSKKQTQ